MNPDDNTSLRVASFACYLDTAKDSIVHRSVSSQQDSPIALTSAGKPLCPPVKPPPFSIKFNKPARDDHSLANIRVDSFSYRHTTAGDNFVFKVPGPIQDPTAAFTFSQSDLPKDGEISVFGADKYFNMKLENNQANVLKQHERKQRREGTPDLPNVKPSSPSLTSEASSWNSQSALITNNTHQKHNQPRHKTTLGRKIFAGFSCKGPCFAKKSIHVTETNTSHSSKPARSSSERMSHPLPDTNTAAMKKLEAQILDESRYSIEVFGSGTKSKGSSDIAANMERKLSMLTWDAIPKGQNLPTSTLSGPTPCDVDMASEASSDLFEIENISGSMFPLLTDDGGIPSSCMMSPTTSHYAPSEASIQWSVVTASAADFSALSDYNEGTSVSITTADGAQRNNVVLSNANSGSGREGQRSRPGGLLGCKSQKSVDVAENTASRKSHNERNKTSQGLDLLSVPFGKSLACSKGRVKVDHIDTLQLPVKSYTSHHP